MQKNGQFILWKHIRHLYEKMNGMAVQSKGLSLVPKVKMEHINLTSYSRMRVDLAAQVNSWKSVHLVLCVCSLLPARASEQGNVIGLVSMSSKKNCNRAN